MISSCLAFFVAFFTFSLCDDSITISSVNDLITLSSRVNSGVNYTGTTVLLGADIDFAGGYSEQFSPIGYSSSRYFRGTFDGQGHVISNLAMNASSQHTGLLGLSYDLTIRRVVIDGTCSIVSSYVLDAYNPDVGSIIGYCYSLNGPCVIENNVNMASVEFGGNTTKNVYIGGIAGAIYSSDYPNTIRNCVNYGTVIDSGVSGTWAEIGGIVGNNQGKSQSYNYVQNSANYGTITHSGTSSTLIIGGIVGVNSHGSFENCVSSGVISTNEASDNIGAVVGRVTSSTGIVHCYWTSDVGDFSVYGYNASTKTVPVTNSSLVSLSQTTLDELNDYAAKNDTWNKWLLVHLDGGSINNITQESLVEIQGYFPDPVKEENTFLSWCKDAECTEKFDPKKDSVNEITDLYAGWDTSATSNYVVTFDFGNGTTMNETFSYGSSIEYPKDVNREGYTFNGWDNDIKFMPAKNITITAKWTINSYVVSFDLGNGTIINATLTYNTSIEYPINPIREGYTFNGWDNDIKAMPARNIIITAKWTINNYVVSFDFGNGTIMNTTLTYNASIEYPKDVNREGYTFDGWDSDIKTVPAKDITITAKWIINYVVTFDFGNGTTMNETLTYNTSIEYPINPFREGYTFDGWDSDIKFMPAKDIIITAKWTINSYVVTFDFGNGTTTNKTLTYNASIEYPINPIREGHSFSRWDSDIKFMPARNITITALWGSNSSNSLVYIAGISATMCATLTFAVIALFFFVMHTRKANSNNTDTAKRYELDKALLSKEVPELDFEPASDDEHTRVVAMSEDEVASDTSAPESGISVLDRLYPAGYVRPVMLDALLMAGITVKNANLVCDACENVGRIAATEGKLADGFTEEDAAAVAMYTYDFGIKEIESNPYRIINMSLVRRDFAGLQKARGLLYLVMTALRKLPKVTGMTLYRGVRGEVNLDEAHYYEGNVVTWVGLSSTSPNMETTRKFLKKGSPKGKKVVGTLFIIEDGWGYDIQPYSLFPEEAEILLEPERKFSVISVSSKGGMTTINLKMLNTPTSLPRVFGSEWQ